MKAVNPFQKATRTKKFLRAAFIAPPGAGKTRGALRVARGLAGPAGRIALIDSEHGSATMFADLCEFDHLELHSFAPDRYVEAIEAAEAAGYDVCVIDSLSHAWAGKDGILEYVDRVKAANKKESYAAWGAATPMHNRLVEKLLTCQLHLIVTLRSKMEHVVEKDERTGRTTMRKIGLQPIQRDGVEFEFDVVADIDVDHGFRISKTRIDDIDGYSVDKVGEAFGQRLRAWLDGGAPRTAAPPPPPKIAPAVKPPVTRAPPAVVPPKVTERTPANQDPISVAKRAIWAEFDRLEVGAGLAAEAQKAARVEALARMCGGKTPDTLPEMLQALKALQREDDPVHELPREPGSDDDLDTEHARAAGAV